MKMTLNSQPRSVPKPWGSKLYTVSSRTSSAVDAKSVSIILMSAVAYSSCLLAALKAIVCYHTLVKIQCLEIPVSMVSMKYRIG